MPTFHRASSTAASRTLSRLACLTAIVLVGALAACGGSTVAKTTADAPAIATDSLGQAITIPKAAPQRIVSLSVVDSDILAALKVDAHVVAVDAYTTSPADLAALPKVTTTDFPATASVERIVALKPDLVLSFDSDYPDAEKQLARAGIEVVDLPNVTTLQAGLTEITLVGQLVHEDGTARQVINGLQGRINAVEGAVAKQPAVTVFLEDGAYQGQYYGYGHGSFGDDLITLAGGANVFSAQGGPKGDGALVLTGESIVAANPQVIVTTEGAQYGGAPADVAARPGFSAIDAVRNSHVYALDGADFNNPDDLYLVPALEELAKALHPSAFGG
jgi:iron complex transport system substrate-binding protein